MTETKEALIDSIKEWLKLENEIKLLNGEVKERKQKKKNLTNNLIETMKNHQIDSFDMSNGKLIYGQSKVKQPINKKLLLDSLSKYFKDENSIEEITQHILDSRNIKVKDNLRFKE